MRHTSLDFDKITRLSNVKQTTFGISKYVVGHKLKVQADLSVTNSNEIKDNIHFRTGFDFHF